MPGMKRSSFHFYGYFVVCRKKLRALIPIPSPTSTNGDVRIVNSSNLYLMEVFYFPELFFYDIIK